MTTPLKLRATVAYPFGPLFGLVEHGNRFGEVIYAVEFDGLVVKVGKSKNPAQRMKTVISDGRKLGLKPLRFMVTDCAHGAHAMERAILTRFRAVADTLETPEDFPASSEWFAGVPIEMAAGLAREWLIVKNSYGHDVFFRESDLRDKEDAEAAAYPAEAVLATDTRAESARAAS